MMPRLIEDGLGECPVCGCAPVAVVVGYEYQVEVDLHSDDVRACYDRSEDDVYIHVEDDRDDDAQMFVRASELMDSDE